MSDGDVVERLRVMVDGEWIEGSRAHQSTCEEARAVMSDALDEIERLRAEVKELEHAIVYAPNDRIIGPHGCQRCGIGPLVTGPLCPWCSKRWGPDRDGRRI